MKEVVINTCYGGFSMSHEGILHYAKLKGIKLDYYIDEVYMKSYSRIHDGHSPSIEEAAKYSFVNYYITGGDKIKDWWYHRDIPRDDPALIQTVKDLGDSVNDRFSKLKVVKIPNNIDYTIEDYDGMEHIAESHKTWS